MRILFYVEPVTFRRNSTLLGPLLNIVRCIINANRDKSVAYGVATSPELIEEYYKWCAHGGLVSLYKATLNERRILAPLGFDRVRYAEALFTGKGEGLEALEAELAGIRDEFQPDVVICFTENASVAKIFADCLVLHMERGPLPRWNGRDNFYLDSMGHQATSILAQRGKDVRSFDISEVDARAVLSRFRAVQRRLSDEQDGGRYFGEWARSKAKGRKIALIATQPHDSVLVAGLTGGLSHETHMMNVLDALPDDWMAIATHHAHADVGEQSAFDQHLTRDYSCFEALPPELRQFSSDVFAAEVDGLITIGSKAAFPAAFLGKKIIAHPKSMLGGISAADVRALDGLEVMTDVERGRFLAFLSNRFTIASEKMFETNGYIISFLTEMLSRGAASDFQLDADAWSMASFDAIFGNHDLSVNAL